MGATLGKNKTASISDKTYEQQKEAAIRSDNQSNGTTTLARKIKKKKEKLAKALSSDVRIDKFTSTDGSVVSSSACGVKQLVGGAGKSILPSDTFNVEGSATYRSATPSKDVLELRDACIRRGIISRETNNVILPTSDEQVEEVKTTGAVKVSINETPVAGVTNNKQVNTTDTFQLSADESNKQVQDERTTAVETAESSTNESVVPIVANNNHVQDEQTTNVDTIEVSANGTSETAVTNDNQVHDEQVKTTDSVQVLTNETPAVFAKKNKKKFQDEQKQQYKS